MAYLHTVFILILDQVIQDLCKVIKDNNSAESMFDSLCLLKQTWATYNIEVILKKANQM